MAGPLSSPVLRSATRELRYHPSRYLATLVAIAISVGFLAAASVVTTTEQNAVNQLAALPYSQADLVVTPVAPPMGDQGDATGQAVTAALTGTPGVAIAESGYNLVFVLGHGDTSAYAVVNALPPDTMAWTTLGEGAWPHGDQIALSPRLADTLGVKIGDRLDSWAGELTVSGITTEPSGRLATDSALMERAWLVTNCGDPSPWMVSWAIRLAPGADRETTASAIKTALSALAMDARVETAAEYGARAGLAALHGIDAIKYLLWIFAAIAMVVGMITIANTFTILLAGRRRQIGLMRLIGASGRQVWMSVWAEALILAVVGVGLGIGLATGLAALIGLYTGSTRFGVQLPPETAVAAALGIVITLLACAVPARRATRVAPLEALQPGGGEAVKRVRVVRAVVPAVLFAAGVGLAAYSLVAAGYALLVAVVGAALAALGVLTGARFFVPPMLRLSGRLVRGWGAPPAAAAKNVLRDPVRASATATALMLAVGLIVTLQVGAASMRATMIAGIEERYPVDVYIAAYPDENNGLAMPDGMAEQLRRIPGVAAVIGLPCRHLPDPDQPEAFWSGNIVCSYLPELAGFAPGLPDSVADGEILVSDGPLFPFPDDDITDNGVVLRSVASWAAAGSYSLVSPATYAKLSGESYSPALFFLSVPNPADGATVTTAVEAVIKTAGITPATDGAMNQRAGVEQVLNLLVAVATGLLAVAVLIALVGVGNTLTLSVIERRRENAVMRALGFTRGQLRRMLAVEAGLLTVVGLVTGVVCGVPLGLLGAKALTVQVRAADLALSFRPGMDWGGTGVLIAILVVAAGLASLLPGRRAAKASPVEALAEV